jgi:hypothetical protein
LINDLIDSINDLIDSNNDLFFLDSVNNFVVEITDWNDLNARNEWNDWRSNDWNFSYLYEDFSLSENDQMIEMSSYLYENCLSFDDDFSSNRFDD